MFLHVHQKQIFNSHVFVFEINWDAPNFKVVHAVKIDPHMNRNKNRRNLSNNNREGISPKLLDVGRSSHIWQKMGELADDNCSLIYINADFWANN